MMKLYFSLVHVAQDTPVLYDSFNEKYAYEIYDCFITNGPIELVKNFSESCCLNQSSIGSIISK